MRENAPKGPHAPPKAPGPSGGTLLRRRAGSGAAPAQAVTFHSHIPSPCFPPSLPSLWSPNVGMGMGSSCPAPSSVDSASGTSQELLDVPSPGGDAHGDVLPPAQCQRHRCLPQVTTAASTGVWATRWVGMKSRVPERIEDSLMLQKNTWMKHIWSLGAPLNTINRLLHCPKAAECPCRKGLSLAGDAQNPGDAQSPLLIP